MQILGKTPLSIAEVKTHLKSVDEEKPIHQYLKKFSKLTKDKLA